MSVEDIREEEEQPHWIVREAFQFLVLGLLLAQGAVAMCVMYGWYWLAVPFVLVSSHLMHGALIGLHEASHGLLRKNRIFNEFDGILIATLSLMSFSLYRVIHQSHHAHLTRERDLEFWPLVQTDVPLWARRLAAFVELNFGMLFTPFVFLRAFLCKNSPVRSPRMRRRIWAELVLTVAFWSGILTAVGVFDLWLYFLWVYLAPAFIAGNLQSWRKYIEHVGLTGSTVKGNTRSIVANNWGGRLISLTLLHEPLHGIHHQRAGLRHSVLSRHVDDLKPVAPDERPPFPSYRHALVDLLRSLWDPRVGPQWRRLEGRVS